MAEQDKPELITSHENTKLTIYGATINKNDPKLA